MRRAANQALYSLRQAFARLRSAPTIHLAAIGAVAVGLFLVGLALLGATNLERLSRFWGRSFPVVAYLKEGVLPEQVERLATSLQRRPEVLALRQISPEQAHRRLRESLGPREGLLDGVEVSFFPTSLELSLIQDHPEGVRALLALLSTSALVEEVDNMGVWAERLNFLLNLLRTIGLILALIVGGACLYIVGSTIRLGIYARREEIEIQRLVGATDRFIKAPFYIEGALQGLLGALLSCGALYLLFVASGPHLERLLSAAVSHSPLGFLSAAKLILILGGGTLLGLLGSGAALSRHLEL